MGYGRERLWSRCGKRGRTTIRAASISLVEECYCRDDSPDQDNIDELRDLFYLRVEWEVEVIVVRMRTRHLRGLRIGQRVQI